MTETRYPLVSVDFRRVELPLGCFDPAGPLPVLVAMRLAAEPQSYLWVIFASYLAASAAATMLLEALSHRQMWCWTPTLISLIHRLLL